MAYSVLLVDDHQILLEGTKSILSDSKEFIIQDTASSGQAALELIRSSQYDILVTDYGLPDLTGLDLIRAAKQDQPQIKTIVLSMHDDPSVVKEILSEGVNGYVLKKESTTQLTAALQKAVSGRRYLSDEISEILVDHLTVPDQKQLLTSREIEIVRLIVKEYSSKQIADLLFISEKTVETHRKNILRKTKVGSLVGLINYAYAHNLIDPPTS